ISRPSALLRIPGSAARRAGLPSPGARSKAGRSALSCVAISPCVRTSSARRLALQCASPMHTRPNLLHEIVPDAVIADAGAVETVYAAFLHLERLGCGHDTEQLDLLRRR